MPKMRKFIYKTYLNDEYKKMKYLEYFPHEINPFL